MKQIRLIFIVTLLVSTGCSLNRIAVRQMVPVMENSADAVYEETDLVLAEQALASNLKLLEGLIKTDPANRDLLLLTVQGFSGYALGFVEDEDPERAKALYLRGRNYGLRILRQQKAFAQAEKADLETFKDGLRTLTHENLPALFWTGFSWAGFISLGLNDPATIMDLPRVEAMMARVMELDSTFFYGGAQLFFGSVYGMKPRLFGGNLEKAKFFFERNLNISQRKFLLTYVYLAKYYAAKTLDEEAFDQYLDIVETTPSEVLEGMALLNEIAKKKAEHLRLRREELF